MRIVFLGAAGSVTGSRFLVETSKVRILVDCGLYQEREYRGRNWDVFPIPPESIDCVALTHGHLDHCGYLPRLYRQGFRGKIYCTATTAEIAKIVMLDAAKLSEEDVKFKKKRHEKAGKKSPFPYEPLYTVNDVEEMSRLFVGIGYDTHVSVGNGSELFMIDAGHILGSACIYLSVMNGKEPVKILFSGDIGRKNAPIIRDPAPLDEADYVVMESTYGARIHKQEEEISNKLARCISETSARGGNVIIPSFAVERAQELIQRIYILRKNGLIPPVPVYLDSPMAIQVTEVLKRHPEILDDESTAMLARGENPFSFEGLCFCTSVEESKKLNTAREAVIIAGSGMCTGGRIKHHLVNHISKPENMVLFVGYQASGTLGRQIIDGASEVRIFGEQREVKAKIESVGGFSAHAGQDELLEWLLTLKRKPKHIFAVHGETSSAEAFAQHVRKETDGWQVSVPLYGDRAILNSVVEMGLDPRIKPIYR